MQMRYRSSIGHPTAALVGEDLTGHGAQAQEVDAGAGR
jgi:hypothetical protein